MKANKLLLLFLLLGRMPVYAQSPNFAGTWKRNDGKTQIEGLSVNSIPFELVIIQSDKQLLIQRISKSANGTVTKYIDQLNFDGSLSEILTPSKLKRSSTGKWTTDKSELMQTFTSKDDQGKVKQYGKQTFTLIDSGKTLKVTAELHYGEEIYRAEEYFDKQ